MSKDLARWIDHTALKPEVTKKDITQLCEEAIEYHFASVCVNPTWVEYAFSLLKDTDVKVCTVIGFPLGATTSESKAFEATEAMENGAAELDMVLNVGRLKDGDFDYVQKDIERVVSVARGKASVKVILETCLLTDEEIVTACKLTVTAGAHFVKTSTGFGSGGATVHDVRLMRETVGQDFGVKASGGIRDRKTMEDMIEAGANRIGASAGVTIVKA